MNVPTKLTAFAAVSAAAFATAFGIGVAVGPLDAPDRPAEPTTTSTPAHDDSDEQHGEGGGR